MSWTIPYPPVLVRTDEAEHLDSIGHVLLADSSTTAGALTTHRIELAPGADGAVPHRHDNSSELFYALDMLAGDALARRSPRQQVRGEGRRLSRVRGQRGAGV